MNTVRRRKYSAKYLEFSFCQKKTLYFFFFFNFRILVFNSKSPVHPVSKSGGGGTVSVTDRTDEGGGQKGLCLILDKKVGPAMRPFRQKKGINMQYLAVFLYFLCVQ